MKTEIKLQYDETKVKVTNHSDDDDSTSLALEFNNGHTVSIIQGSSSYGGLAGFFEVAIIDEEGLFNGAKIMPDEFGEEQVKGWLTEADVYRIINKVQAL